MVCVLAGSSTGGEGADLAGASLGCRRCRRLTRREEGSMSMSGAAAASSPPDDDVRARLRSSSSRGASRWVVARVEAGKREESAAEKGRGGVAARVHPT